MKCDRYTKLILTIIAIELFWLGLVHSAAPVAAQADPTPVIIRGIQLPGDSMSLPVGIVGWSRSTFGANAYQFQSMPLPVQLPR